MHEIYFYADKRGRQPVYDYMRKLKSKRDKNSQIKFNKIADYIEALRQFGLFLPENYLKHLDGVIYELRPIRDRILFAANIDGSFILLHSFVKKTQKTPTREIEKAKREFNDYLRRQEENEED